MKNKLRIWSMLALVAVLLLGVSRPLLAQAQDDGNEDAGDEEMLTGQPANTPTRPGGARSAVPEKPPEAISYITQVDRTAVWVGDVFHYYIVINHDANIEFVLENLNKETLTLDPLKVIDVQSKETALKNGQKRLFVDIALSSFTVGAPTITIPQLTVFYFTKDSTGANAEGQAAQSLTIAGPVVALRSTLPPDPPDLRDAVTVSVWPGSRSVIGGIGWTALLLLLAGIGWEGATLVRNRGGRRGPDPRKAMAAIQDRWARSVPGDYSNPQVVMDFYGRSYQDVKEYLGFLIESPTAGLTAEEMREEMTRRAANPDLTDRASKVLTACEDLRYGRNGKAISPDAGRDLAQSVREVFEIASHR